MKLLLSDTCAHFADWHVPALLYCAEEIAAEQVLSLSLALFNPHQHQVDIDGLVALVVD